MSEFYKRKDGYWQWDAPAFTFLIGGTNELVPHVALWVTPVVTLSYKMVERINIHGIDFGEALARLKNEAKILVIRSKVIGGAAFIEYINGRQDQMDELMFWVSSQLLVPTYIEEATR